MLSKKNRLILSGKNPKKFAKKVTGQSLVVAYNKTDGTTKAAVTVSKKVAKKAVDRNRIKRTITEAIKGIAPKNLELLIKVTENIATLKTQEVQKRLESIIKKI